eukprot:scaffold121861_cov72-Phaeocystis_antarctica.AAC.4
MPFRRTSRSTATTVGLDGDSSPMIASGSPRSRATNARRPLASSAIATGPSRPSSEPTSVGCFGSHSAITAMVPDR